MKAVFLMGKIVIVLFCSFFLGEIATRIYFLAANKKGYIWLPDEYLGIIHTPNNIFIYEEDFSREFKIRRQTNQIGCVGRNAPFHKKAGTYRILVLGDSFTEGLHVREGKNFCEQLGYLLNKNNFSNSRVFEVINAGVSGASPISELLLLERELIKLSPDLIVLQMFSNDVFEDNKVRAMSILDKDGYPVKINKVFIRSVSGTVVNNGNTHNTDARFYSFKKFIISKSAFYQSITRAQNKRLKNLKFNKQMTQKNEFNDNNQFFIIQDYNSLFQDIKFRDSALNNTKKYILAIRNLSLKKNAGFFIFLIPPEGQLDLDKYGEHSSSFTKRRPNRYLNEELQKFCNQEHIPFIDLLPVFEKNKDRGLYYSKDGHTNEQGHKLIAETLLDYVIKL